MLDLFGKNYRQNFRMVLSCHYKLMNYNNTCNFPSHILVLKYIYILREKHTGNIDVLIDNLM